jgi:hypothetical protein
MRKDYVARARHRVRMRQQRRLNPPRRAVGVRRRRRPDGTKVVPSQSLGRKAVKLLAHLVPEGRPRWQAPATPKSVVPETLLRWARWRELTQPARNPHDD